MADEDRTTCPSMTKKGHAAYVQRVPVSVGGKHKIPVDMRPVIPIVFLPGVMGTNLQNPDFPEPVWEPDKGFSLWLTYKDLTGEERQTRLDMTKAVVYDGGEINVALNTASEATLRERGWGSVMASSYHLFMTLMQMSLNRVSSYGTLDPSWQKRQALRMQKYGMSSGMEPLTKDELTNLAKFRFEVWACGYNWIQSNVESAEHVKAFIRDTVLASYEKEEKIAKETAQKEGREGEESVVRLAAKKVILVTHSMGGLVARQLCSDAGGGRDLILGVVHGAQPSNGAGETYTNLRQGVQGSGVEGSMKATIIGDSTAALGPVFTQCLGGLQLLPFGFNNAYNPYVEYYNRGVQTFMRLHPPGCLSPDKHQTSPGAWLYWQHPEKGLLEHAGGEKIYDDIYKCELDPQKADWHRLLPRHNVQYFDPAGILRRDNEDTPSHEIFNGFINQVWKFHKNIVGYYHPTTYAFWSAGTDTAATGEALWQWSRHMEWRGSMLPILTPVETPERDTGKGEYMQGRDHYTLHDVKQPGDGTVPRASWQRDLSAQSMKGYCLLGDTTEDPKGFSHQDAFNDSRAQEATLYFLTKVVNNRLEELQS